MVLIRSGPYQEARDGMFRMNKLTDYGILLLTRMATAPEGGISARELAEETRIPLPTVGKILKILLKEGLLVSHRGTKGGYALSRTPSEITVAEIIRALEGPIAMTECDENTCELESGCPTRSHWKVVNRTILGALQNLTLREMTQPARSAISLPAIQAVPAASSLRSTAP
jgi:FeS assembly SUF system regulator